MNRPLKTVAQLVTKVEASTVQPYLALEHVASGTGELVSGVTLEEREPTLSGMATVHPGDVLFGKLRPYLAKVHHADTDLLASTELMCLRPMAGVNPRWLYYTCLAKPVVEWAVATAEGVKMPRTSWEKFREFGLDLPTVEKQRGIADFLDRETARIDALIEKRRSQVRLLKAKWRGTVKARMHELSQHHGTIPLKRLVKCLDGKRVPLSAEDRQHRQGPFPYYGASGVIDSVDDWLFDEELVLLGEDGAQLGDPDYDISFVVRGKCWVNNHAHVLRPLDADAGFLALHLSTFDRFAFMSGATREKITQNDMNQIPVPHMSAEEQRQESARLSKHQRQVISLRDHLNHQVELLNERRQALITAAVTGQIDISSAA